MTQLNGSGGGVPVGTSAYFDMEFAPSGWLEENGAIVDIGDFPKLYAVIGTRYGGGDGIATFGLPDSRGEFWRGLDNGRGVDGGRVLGSAQSDSIASHSHTLDAFAEAFDSGGIATGGGSFSRNRSTALAGGAETRPRNLPKLACIKY